ncbi:cupin domain-containing protein [Actinorugispora endophytica]|uniref:Quercetin dioxygenase-like cupin family protein n=1 Tax=Actinorugispora endophytica TaxID=1605990 RepID=A0A4R6UW64_9ACTN|nr:cupin domain-containing protein [Actinorugispora endophytica]TDQ51600.1 quercetin dioxygenase-like cupin family protein [Actinorugispora endophytica]
MRKLSLDALAEQQLRRAAEASSGRSATTVHGGHEHALRQTLLALTEGRSLDDHPSPGESTLFVLRGRVRLTSGDDAWDARSGDLLILPRATHALHALADSALLLTVVMPR